MKNITLLTAASVLVFAASFQARAESLQTQGTRPALVARADVTQVRAASAPTAYVADPGKRGAYAAARQGPDALRRYVQRTRMIYALDQRDFEVR